MDLPDKTPEQAFLELMLPCVLELPFSKLAPVVRILASSTSAEYIEAHGHNAADKIDVVQSSWTDLLSRCGRIGRELEHARIAKPLPVFIALLKACPEVLIPPADWLRFADYLAATELVYKAMIVVVGERRTAWKLRDMENGDDADQEGGKTG